ncbi:DUF305 domain-containing protein [Endozoicomonas numazuensis]|uniref:DUF305 domain-containing protein n=1 Tax=Endozoicomonas numazuensis TaxID=1137799 RepID=UPI0009DF88CB|nr:DUF305 domain-containing protein [Endozoicomonas numazuensis]
MKKITLLACLIFPMTVFAHNGVDHSAATGNAFKEKNMQAMVKMHHGMENAGYTGDNDIDFLRMMIPHHAGAVDMAEIILETTKDEELKNLAQGIITDQKNEIKIMKQLLEMKQAEKSN